MPQRGNKGAKWKKAKVLTPEMLETMKQCLLRGNFLETAAHIVNVSPKLARAWMWQGGKEFKRRENGDKPNSSLDMFVEFYEAVQQSIHVAEDKAVTNLTDAGDRDWRASAHYLSRRHRERWGKSLTFVLQDEINGILDKLQCGLTEGEFEKVLSICTEESSEDTPKDSEGEKT